MSDVLHPVVEVAIELMTATEDNKFVLDLEARSTLVEVLNDLTDEQLPLAVYALTEYAAMLELQYDSPRTAKELLNVAEGFVDRLESYAAKNREDQADSLVRGGKFLGLNLAGRPNLNSSAPKKVMRARDVIQEWRGVISCS